MKKLFLIISIITLSNVIVFSQEMESGRTNDAKPSDLIPVVSTVVESNKLEPIQQEAGSDQDLTSNVSLPSDSLQNDQVIADDLIVQGSIGCGIDMVNNYSFGYNTFVMSENNTRILFDDTSNSAGFPSNDWVLEANETSSGGVNHFAINDVTGSKVPFKIIAGAPTNSFYLNNYGNIGVGTSSPVLKLHLQKGDTPGLRLDQDASSGWTPQIWDLVGNESNFIIRDVTGGSTLPFRIQPGTPTNTLTLRASGNVGLGTWSPEAKLHVVGNIKIDSVLRFNPIDETKIIPNEGTVFMDNVKHTLRLYNGTAWVSMSDNQLLSLTGNDLSIDNGNSVDLSGYLDNTDQQGISLTANILGITGSATAVDLSSYMDNTDEQMLSLAGNDLSIDNGNTVDLSRYLDNTDRQEISLTDNILTISGSNSTVNLSKYLNVDDSDDQVLLLTENFLYIEDGNTVDMSKFLDNTDNQEINLSNDILTISGSNAKIDLSDLRDNTDRQEIKLVNDTLRITGSDSIVVLSRYLDNTDNQSLILAENKLKIENGNSVDLSNYLDNTDRQEIKLINDTLSITGSDSIVVLSDYLDNTDEQLLGLSGNNLSIENGNSVDLSTFMDNTDKQEIKLMNDTLTITGSDSVVVLTNYLDNTDEQSLLLEGTILSISNGNNVDLSALLIEKQQQIDELSLQIEGLNNAINELKKMFAALSVDTYGENETLKSSSIGQNIPNPFSLSTVIPFNVIDNVKNAYIEFYTQKGQLVKRVKINERGNGKYTFVPSSNESIFMYTLFVDGQAVGTKKMLFDNNGN
jgi:ethanolamine utilization protein EutP (predicted NTPase)